jgi:glycosyltransferase involved in cell wall biosynthesis
MRLIVVSQLFTHFSAENIFQANQRLADGERAYGTRPKHMTQQAHPHACAYVLMFHLRADPLFAITVPHKVFTYLAAGKPVLVGGEGDVAFLVTGERAGIAVQPDNPEALASAVVKLHSMSTTEREAMGGNGCQVACQLYSRAQLVGEICRMIEAAVN